MRKKLYRIVAVLMIVMMCTVGTATAAFADDSLGVTVPIKISLKGTQPATSENFVVTLKAEDQSNPMPKGSLNGIYAFTIAGEGNADIIIPFDKLGVYKYTIYQQEGNNSSCTYDNSVYNLTVYVTNAEDGSGLEVTAALYLNNEGEKLPGVDFTNEYDIVVTPDMPKTGDESAPWLYLGLFAVSAVAIASLLVFNRKRDQQ